MVGSTVQKLRELTQFFGFGGIGQLSGEGSIENTGLQISQRMQHFCTQLGCMRVLGKSGLQGDFNRAVLLRPVQILPLGGA